MRSIHLDIPETLDPIKIKECDSMYNSIQVLANACILVERLCLVDKCCVHIESFSPSQAIAGVITEVMLIVGRAVLKRCTAVVESVATYKNVYSDAFHERRMAAMRSLKLSLLSVFL